MDPAHPDLPSAQPLRDNDDVGRNPSTQPSFASVLRQRLDRRQVLKRALGLAALSTLPAGDATALWSPSERSGSVAPGFDFEPVARGVDTHHHIAKGYDAQILLRWGDPILAQAPRFDPQRQNATAQAGQFGYNCDYVGFVPLNGRSDHGLLCVNHEYPIAHLMFPGVRPQSATDAQFSDMSPQLVQIEMASVGASIIEIRRDGQLWQLVEGSPYARRITAAATAMRLTGPAAGHQRLRTSGDPGGAEVVGTLNNCAGCITPWGSFLSAEENFHEFFGGKLAADHREQENHQRYGVPTQVYGWARYERRFDVGVEPNEANRFGWMVEIDPLDPSSVPRKHSALGRMKHEGAGCFVNADGRVVLYMGDDEVFEYIYKFVSRSRLQNGKAPADLLADGILYAARFLSDGSVQWLPLVFGQPPLDAEHGFHDQGDVLIETRRAADLLGATPMDRPEELEVHPDGRVFVALTNNSSRKAEQVDGANPRAQNRWGHIVELTADDGDHTATSARWELLVRCGDPSDPSVDAQWAKDAGDWFACPDNFAIDPLGRLWVGTDQGEKGQRLSGGADGLYALCVDGPARGRARRFFRAPAGAEVCGPEFTPDGTTLFLAVQHPGDGGKAFAEFGRVATFDDPLTRWPDFDPALPPRPSVLAITRHGGGRIA